MKAQRLTTEAQRHREAISLCLCASVDSLLFICGAASAASPELTTIMPRGGQRGTEVVVDFQGDRLADAADIVVHEPGLSILKIEHSAKSVKATLKIAADCPLGEHSLRV